MELFGYLLLAASVVSASITAGMLFGLRSAIESHGPSFGAEMFKHSYFVRGLIPYVILGFRASTGWFRRNGAKHPVQEQANLAKIPFLTTLALASGSVCVLNQP